MAQSLDRKLTQRARSQAAKAVAKKAEGVGRTTQVVHSTVTVGDVDTSLDGLLVDAADTSVVVVDQSEDLARLDEVVSVDVDDLFDSSEQEWADSDDSHDGRMTA